jgi:hypothetical protein
VSNPDKPRRTAPADTPAGARAFTRKEQREGSGQIHIIPALELPRRGGCVVRTASGGRRTTALGTATASLREHRRPQSTPRELFDSVEDFPELWINLVVVHLGDEKLVAEGNSVLVLQPLSYEGENVFPTRKPAQLIDVLHYFPGDLIGLGGFDVSRVTLDDVVSISGANPVERLVVQLIYRIRMGLLDKCDNVFVSYIVSLRYDDASDRAWHDEVILDRVASPDVEWPFRSLFSQFDEHDQPRVAIEDL